MMVLGQSVWSLSEEMLTLAMNIRVIWGDTVRNDTYPILQEACSYSLMVQIMTMNPLHAMLT